MGSLPPPGHAGHVHCTPARAIKGIPKPRSRYPPRVERFDFVIIGAGAAGEAAIALACARGSSAAIVDEDLFGGSCAYWACMPSKALLHAAAVHHGGGDFPWQKASDFRDWMIDREGIDYPDDSPRGSRATATAGGVPIRGTARIVGPGRVDVALDRRRRASARGRCHRRRHRFGDAHPPDGGTGSDPVVDKQRGDLSQGAPAKPADHGRRADRRGARPGLRPVRGARHDHRLQRSPRLA